MRLILLLELGLVALLLPGCGWFHKNKSQAAAAPAPAIVSPAHTVAAYILKVNEAGRFVILNFPGGQPMAAGQSMFIYRNGAKVGEVKISGPQQDSNTVADILSGDVHKGDEARGE